MWFRADGHMLLWTKDADWNVWDWQRGWLKIKDPDDPALDFTGTGVVPLGQERVVLH